MVEKILASHQVTGLLRVTWQREEETVSHYIGRGRGSSNRPTQPRLRVRYVIADLQRDRSAIEAYCRRLGWRAQVTNAPVERLSLSQGIIQYRASWSVERSFHMLKDQPLGISPLFVHRDDQIIGITYLLTLALQMMTLLEAQVHRQLVKIREKISGLYAGQPKRATDRPTAVSLLEAISRKEVSLTQVRMGRKRVWHITPLPHLLQQVLGFLGLSSVLYTGLVENSS